MELSRCSDLCRIQAHNGKGHFFLQSLGFCSHLQCYLVVPQCRLSGLPSFSPRLKHNLRHCWVICCVQNLQTRWQHFTAHGKSTWVARSWSFHREPAIEGKALPFAFTVIIFNIQSPIYTRLEIAVWRGITSIFPLTVYLLCFVLFHAQYQSRPCYS